jgi:Ca2+-binding RTX toxin-like protein
MRRAILLATPQSDGNDFIVDTAASTLIEAGLGADTVFGQGGNDIIDGDAGNDRLDGNDGNDQIYGGIGNDVMYGNAGRDVMYGGEGNDTVFGGDSNDTIYAAGLGGYLESGASDATDSQNLLYGGLGSDTIYGGAGLDVLRGEGDSDSLNGFAGHDTLFGNDGNDTLLGGAGNDVIYGGAGADYLDGEAGDDILFGEGGEFGTVGGLHGGHGHDQLVGTGSVHNVLFTGGAGSDTITGSDGNDRIYADQATNTGSEFGNDNYLSGGNGADTLWSGWGNDRLGGGSGVDTASYAIAEMGVRISLAYAAAQATGGAGTDTLSSIENLIGSAFNDVLRGSNGANRIEGGAGNDWILGGLGVDTFVGGAGADQLVFLLGDSVDTTWDTFTDFSHAQGDRIDLHFIDADVVTAGDQAFTWIGASGFDLDATGQLRYEDGVVYGSTDADGDAEFALYVTGAPALVSADFYL